MTAANDTQALAERAFLALIEEMPGELSVKQMPALTRFLALASRLQEQEGQPALSDRVSSFRQLLAAEIGASIDVSGDIARQEAQIDLADHLLVKFNELFPEAS